MGLSFFTRKRQQEDPVAKSVALSRLRPGRPNAAETFEPAELVDLYDDSLHRQFQLGRLGMLAVNVSHWQNHPDVKRVHEAAVKAIDDRFGLVPAGFAALPYCIDDSPGCQEADVETAPFLLARHPVTNAEYQYFVDVGAYSELELWPQDVWPHLIDFKDSTGNPGPRFWREGRHDRRLADHPVVGICHYEAAAYARWAGYRLSSEAEWQMAASWRVRCSANVLRRYPWGDAFDVQRCNLWAAGLGQTVPVTAYEQGAAPNGVCQLIGNVWEWTASPFEVMDPDGHPVVGDMLLMSIRGGAYDTYFPSQATSCFRTGLATLARAHNVGFRCALDATNE
jgi:gamma-glutamyl hercynylcysteine S-oxide synthase